MCSPRVSQVWRIISVLEACLPCPQWHGTCHMRGDSFVLLSPGGDCCPLSIQISSALGWEHQPWTHGNNRPPAAPWLLPLFFPQLISRRGIFIPASSRFCRKMDVCTECQQRPLVAGREVMAAVPSNFLRANKEMTIVFSNARALTLT